MRTLLATLLVLALQVAPRAAQACAVCTAGRDDETQAAFLWTTLFLSVLPVGMAGALVLWLRRRLRAHERAGSERSTAGAVGAPPARS